MAMLTNSPGTCGKESDWWRQWPCSQTHLAPVGRNLIGEDNGQAHKLTWQLLGGIWLVKRMAMLTSSPGTCEEESDWWRQWPCSRPPSARLAGRLENRSTAGTWTGKKKSISKRSSHLDIHRCCYMNLFKICVLFSYHLIFIKKIEKCK